LPKLRWQFDGPADPASPSAVAITGLDAAGYADETLRRGGLSRRSAATSRAFKSFA
jgi:hypothetical protein